MTQYKKAPLVELIAELRWDVPQATGAVPGLQFHIGAPGMQMPMFGYDQARTDKLLGNFSQNCFEAGIHSVERIVPPGFPTMPGQVVNRLKQSPASAELYQIGPGVWTANAVPPYHSWSRFTPFLDAGLEILLRSRVQEEQDIPFSSVSLQYIDAFGPELTQSLSSAQFIQEILGYRVETPDAVSKAVKNGTLLNSNFQLSAVLESGLLMNMSIGEGLANNLPAIIIHTNIRAENVEPSAQKLSEILHVAQAAHHSMFEGTIEKIRHLLEPI